MSLRFACVGAVQEGQTCFQRILDAGYRPEALITLTGEQGQALSGWVDWGAFAARYRVPLLMVPTINSPQAEAVLRALAPDILFVIGWTEIVKPHILALPTRGCIGMHASLLPHYRGSAPVNWALINGETVTGNTMFWFSPGVDTGDIIAQAHIPISFDDTCATLYEKVAAAGGDMLLEHLPALLEDRAPRRPQTEILPKMPRRYPRDGIVDWTKSPTAQYNWVRALTHPYPGAFAYLPDGRQVFIWAVQPLDLAAPAESVPGQILGVLDELLLARTGEGVIGLARLQVADAEEMTGEQFYTHVLQDTPIIFLSQEPVYECADH